MSQSSIHFVVPTGDISPNDRLQHIAIQATAIMLRGWFKEEVPTAEKAKAMVAAIMDALLQGHQTRS